jgi:hypothetical protein
MERFSRKEEIHSNKSGESTLWWSFHIAGESPPYIPPHVNEKGLEQIFGFPYFSGSCAGMGLDLGEEKPGAKRTFLPGIPFAIS